MSTTASTTSRLFAPRTRRRPRRTTTPTATGRSREMRSVKTVITGRLRSTPAEAGVFAARARGGGGCASADVDEEAAALSDLRRRPTTALRGGRLQRLRDGRGGARRSPRGGERGHRRRGARAARQAEGEAEEAEPEAAEGARRGDGGARRAADGAAGAGPRRPAVGARQGRRATPARCPRSTRRSRRRKRRSCSHRGAALGLAAGRRLPRREPPPPERVTAVELALDELAAATDDFADGRGLGSGGFGEVYAAEEMSSLRAERLRPVALRALKPAVKRAFAAVRQAN